MRRRDIIGTGCLVLLIAGAALLGFHDRHVASRPPVLITRAPTITPMPAPTIAPTATPISMNFMGKGKRVTSNFELPGCYKSVFSWSVDPSDYGSASLILKLHHVESGVSYLVANELDVDLTGPLTGESLQSVSAGTYYLSIENTDERWHIHWECQDE